MDNSSQKIGVLLPQSSTFPLIGKAFLAGLRLALDQMDYSLEVESIGIGADAEKLTNVYQKFIYQNNVSITTGLFGHYGFEDLANFASNNEEVIVAANLGATRPIQLPEGIFQNSLDLYSSLFSLVDYFDQNNIQNVATSTCYYESGYGYIEALESAMIENNNVHFGGHFITPLHPRENESELMEATFKAINPEAIIAFHSGEFAQEHASFLAKNKAYQDYPIFTLPFSATDQVILAQPEVFENIQTVSTWFPELDTEENKTFITQFQKAIGKAPDFFALLGYENGLIIKNALQKSKNTLKENIQNTDLKGPRGKIEFDQEFRKTKFVPYLWKNKIDNTQSVQRILTQQLNGADLKQLDNLQPVQGWFNAYLCR